MQRAVAAILALTLAAPSAWSSPSPVGSWLTENGHGVIEILPCGNGLCGRIVGIDRSTGEKMPTDVYGRSQCGLVIITNASTTEDDAWLGDITDPRTGNTYRTRFRVDDRGELQLRGYIGIPLFGKTQVWRRYTGSITADCGMTGPRPGLPGGSR